MTWKQQTQLGQRQIRLRRAADGRARARRGVSSATTASRAAEGTKSQDTATRSEQPHFLSRQAEADACAAVQELKRLKAVEQPSLTAWALLAGERYEQALSAKLAQGNAAAERLVEANKGLIMLFVKRYTSQGVDADDLYVAGASGLLNAAENFDPARGMRLMTLAYLSIPRAMTRAVEQMGSVGRKDDDAEKTLADVIADGAADGSADPEQEMWGEVMQRHFKDDLEAILDTLPNSKDRQVLALLYGLYEYQRPHTLREVGEKLQLSHERVRQLKNACMDRLKETGRLEPLLVYLEGGSRMR
ncbi:hypothetical protein WJX72_006232 [[Myrmecia] bisecta]|uniref:RNA polymerase sigma factor n=1 Tax=[Myrmecia] bisecta TaxID=41462 RepID=A0AAW1R6P3_9CHLO